MSPALVISRARALTSSRFLKFFSVTLVIGTCFSAMSQHAPSAKISTCTGNAGSETSVTGDWWKSVRLKARIAAKKAASKASSIYAPLYSAKVIRALGPVSEADFRKIPISLLEDMNYSVQKSSQIYTSISDGHSLSIGDDGLPDCVAQYDDETETLWIICRGSQTASDVLTGTTWLENTAKIGPLDIPIGIVTRCSSIIPNLLEHLEILTLRKNKIERIIFTGHSLGGAVATALYLTWNLVELFKLYPNVKTSAISIGAPLLISNPPKGFSTTKEEDDNIDINLNLIGVQLSKNVHNIVTQMDLVPRILGKHPLPDFISEMNLGNFFNRLLLKNIRREKYRPFGNFYSLRLPSSVPLKKSSKFMKMKMLVPVEDIFLICLVSDPENNLLNIFPDNKGDVMYSLHKDHSLNKSFIAIETALLKAKNLKQ